MDDIPIDLSALADRFAAVDPRLLLVAVVLQLANLGLRSRAWQNVLRASYPDRPVPFGRIASAYAAGVALNAILPGRGGDVAKAAFGRLAIPGSAIATVGAALLVTGIFDTAAGAATLAAAYLTGATPRLPNVTGHAIWALALVPLASAVYVVVRRGGDRIRSIGARIACGGAILRTPLRYLSGVALVQAAAWACRVGVVLALLRAFGIPAGIAGALLVIVVGGLSTAVPAPGGAGAQQVLLVYVLAKQTTTASALSFSIGMQVGVTALNLTVGLIAAMVLFRTAHPLAALRAGRTALAAERASA